MKDIDKQLASEPFLESHLECINALSEHISPAQIVQLTLFWAKDKGFTKSDRLYLRFVFNQCVPNHK